MINVDDSNNENDDKKKDVKSQLQSILYGLENIIETVGGIVDAGINTKIIKGESEYFSNKNVKTSYHIGVKIGLDGEEAVQNWKNIELTDEYDGVNLKWNCNKMPVKIVINKED